MSNYIYNGIVLPALPEWDKTVYPYAVIAIGYDGNTYGLYRLYQLQEIEYYTSHSGLWCFYVQSASNVVYKTFGDEEWQSENLAGQGIDVTTVVWTNTDILNEDGTLYLAASDPIPVTAPQLDPLSIWMGWEAGNWVARQRGKA